MLNNLGHLFLREHRQAEKVDTRLGIRRQDKDSRQKKSEKDDSEKTAHDPATDEATVSIDALYVFLSRLVQQSIPEKNSQNSQKISPKTEQAAPSNPSSRAASLYAKTAKTTGKNPEIPTRQDEQPTLNTDDQRQIYQLLEKLRILQSRKIQTLHIEPAASFLNGLINAADKALIRSR